MYPSQALSTGRPTTRAAAFLIPVLLGAALFGLTGFASQPALHDALHDVRHAAGFPCH
ncbi:MAG: CbtB-domain containing protein [Leptospirillia bacterium]